ncbi:MAG: hypothetical protein A3F68_09180 [Acidobacteria bacterium RIFCSPLOWO2_12_FULL_54_10]|nr:MAG: hypothetical protein A3F68_09180 [Acidobacteria bacterium RIFCSPLOWO2_12_FULL_54_10]
MLLIHRLFIKTALVYLLLGAAAGGWMLLEQARVVPVSPKNLFSIHIHLVGIGFFLMMVCGVALWMFPRKSGEDRVTAAREPFAWATYILLTGGLAIRCMAMLFPEIFSNRVLAVSVFIQVGGILSFVLSIWPRIYMPGAKLPIERKDRFI